MAVASSSTSGFFQAAPVLPPQYTSQDDDIAASDDKILARILHLYLPENIPHITQHIHHLSRRSLDPKVLIHATDAETNHPVLRPLNTFGDENKNDPLWTTAGWQKLKEIGYEEGLVAVAYDDTQTSYNRRVYEFALNHVWASTGTMTGCPMSMTDGAATLLKKHLDHEDETQPGRRDVFREVYRRLTSRDPAIAWTSGQWMTERSGGSDVSGTETVATRLDSGGLAQEAKTGSNVDAIGLPLGPWRIDGAKWFSSATDSEMSVMLARTDKGLSAFMAPMRRRFNLPGDTNGSKEMVRTELNGIRIQRLKNKLGTKSLPTAELELKGTRAWLIGIEGQGIKEISTILNITRLYTSAGSTAGWGRGLAVCRAYSKVRKVRSGLLQNNPAHLHWMSDETVKYWAATHFCFLAIALQGAVEQDWSEMVANTKADKLIPKEQSQAMALLRFLTPVLKSRTSVASVHGLRECMECLGGVGYCENNEEGGLMNIAKVYRDTLVNPIWEGTVNVLAEDMVRVLMDKRLGNGDILKNVFADWVHAVLHSCSGVSAEEKTIIEERLQTLIDLVRGASKEELLYRGREILEHVEFIACACLLAYDATVGPAPTAEEAARRWVYSRSATPLLALDHRSREACVRMDRSVFLGTENDLLKETAKL
jgi:alkylation response protein AidB-like acyl-CoA dehydrogenase